MEKLDDERLSFLKASLQDMAYGSVVITVHDGSITQIDTTEKKRFVKNASLSK